ncbi:MAG TPA: glycosyl transferase, partial [Flavobacterium sp.]|nr:glycosyl transferase [Flavobacterium sp.]
MSALVSIITPSYNVAKFIAETIQSVQNQTYQNWEMIIVDDNSSDETVSIVTKYILNDSRICLYQLQKNCGAGVARNKAIEMAQGNFIAFLDADDLWKPEKLEKQLRFMQEQNIPFTYSFYEIINENGVLQNKTLTTPAQITYK